MPRTPLDKSILFEWLLSAQLYAGSLHAFPKSYFCAGKWSSSGILSQKPLSSQNSPFPNPRSDVPRSQSFLFAGTQAARDPQEYNFQTLCCGTVGWSVQFLHTAPADNTMNWTSGALASGISAPYWPEFPVRWTIRFVHYSLRPLSDSAAEPFRIFLTRKTERNRRTARLLRRGRNGDSHQWSLGLLWFS